MTQADSDIMTRTQEARMLPYAPYVRGSETSARAAASVREKTPTQASIVLDFLLSRGPHGATDDEIDIATEQYGWTPADHRRARRGLAVSGLVVVKTAADGAVVTRRSRRGHSMGVWITAQQQKEQSL